MQHPTFEVPKETAWRLANRGQLRINTQTRRLALVYAAEQCQESFDWLALDSTHPLTIDRLIDDRVDGKGAHFGLLVAAVKARFGPQIQERVDALVGAS